MDNIEMLVEVMTIQVLRFVIGVDSEDNAIERQCSSQFDGNHSKRKTAIKEGRFRNDSFT